MKNAVIYSRVSDAKQEKDGHGAESQEKRGLSFALSNGYTVAEIFRDGGISGKFEDRPAFKQMMEYLTLHPGTTVIIDDIKRLSRQVKVHILLKEAIKKLDCDIVYLNHQFDDTPEGRFVEIILAGAAQLEREQNARQVKQKMKVRLEMGYWVFNPPVGYRFERVNGNKIMVRNEPVATIVQEALEGYAYDRFTTQVEVHDFLTKNKIKFPKSTIKEFLMNLLYAGFYQLTKWDVPFMKGLHEPIIKFETHEEIVKKLEGKPQIAYQTHTNDEFPLRGYICCESCNRSMTAAWSKGRSKKYAYYFCQNKDCELKGKNIAKDKVESELLELLQKIQPKAGVIKAFTRVFDYAWQKESKQYSKNIKELETELNNTKEDIKMYLERIKRNKNESETLIQTYEGCIIELEKQKLVLEYKLGSTDTADSKYTSQNYRTLLDRVTEFATGFVNMWQSGDYQTRSMIITLVFEGKIVYSLKDGYRTPVLSDLFQVFRDFQNDEFGMVDLSGLEPLTSCLPGKRSNQMS